MTDRKDTWFSANYRLAPLTVTESRIGVATKFLFALYAVILAGASVYTHSKGIQVDLSTYFAVNGINAMNASGIAALYIAFLACRPSKDMLHFSFVLILVFEILYQMFVLPVDFDWFGRSSTIGGGAGCVGILGMLGLFFFDSETRARTKVWLLAGLCLFFYPMAGGKLIAILSDLTPQVLDSHVYRFEGSLGFFPSQEVARYLLFVPVLNLFAVSLYSRLPLIIFYAVWVTILYPRKSYFDVFAAFLAGGFLAFPLYLVLPMVGIDVVTGTPPWPILDLQSLSEFKWLDAPNNFPRSCIPSMHTAWTVVFYFSIRRISVRAHLIIGAIALFTLISTMNAVVGHYFVDVLVGVPFGLCLIAIGTNVQNENWGIRLQCFAFGLGCTLFWSLTFRFFPEVLLRYNLLGWSLMLLGVILTFVFESRLAQKTLGSVDKAESNPA